MQSPSALKDALFYHITERYGAPLQRSKDYDPEGDANYNAADALAKTVADRVLALEPDQRGIALPQAEKLADMAFCVFREARKSGIIGYRDSSSKDGVRQCDDVTLAIRYFNTALHRILGTPNPRDIQDSDIFITKNGGTISAVDFLKTVNKDMQQQSFAHARQS